MIHAEITNYLESIAPPAYQEGYDNCGYLTGNEQAVCTGVLISLDCIEAVVDEAIRLKCSLIISHHPILFSGLKKITGRNYIERTILKAIKNDITIYAIHTNLDNIYNGVNNKICELLQLQALRILQPKAGVLKKLVTYVPASSSNQVMQALFDAGCGDIGNYSDCAYQSEGTGSFKANEKANPYVGTIGTRHYEAELRIETIYEAVHERKVLKALLTAHPYEEPAFDIYRLENTSSKVGAGMTGELTEPIDTRVFLKKLAEIFKVPVIKHTDLTCAQIKKVAVCGGSGSFLLSDAIKAGADIFITADYKYHQFFDAEDKIIIADIGHYESEQFTINLIYDLLKQNFTTFALHFTKIHTNPVRYFYNIET